MLPVIGLLSIFGFFFFCATLLWVIIRKKAKRPALMGIAICFVTFVVCVMIDPGTTSTPSTSVDAAPVTSGNSSESVSTKDEISSSQISISQPSSSEETQSDENNEETQSDESQPDENKKESARTIDSKIAEIIFSSEQSNKALISAIGELANGGTSALQLYSDAKKAKEVQLSYFSQLQEISDEDNENYVYACKMYVLNARDLADSLMKYLDKQEMKYLSRAQDDIDSIDGAVLEIVTKRISYLSSQGFSDDEIIEMVHSKDSSSEES